MPNYNSYILHDFLCFLKFCIFRLKSNHFFILEIQTFCHFSDLLGILESRQTYTYTLWVHTNGGLGAWGSSIRNQNRQKNMLENDIFKQKKKNENFRVNSTSHSMFEFETYSFLSINVVLLVSQVHKPNFKAPFIPKNWIFRQFYIDI